MGSSARKKSDKKKDFQVRRPQQWVVQPAANRSASETKAESRKSTAKTDQFYRHKVQV